MKGLRESAPGGLLEPSFFCRIARNRCKRVRWKDPIACKSAADPFALRNRAFAFPVAGPPLVFARAFALVVAECGVLPYPQRPDTAVFCRAYSMAMPGTAQVLRSPRCRSHGWSADLRTITGRDRWVSVGKDRWASVGRGRQERSGSAISAHCANWVLHAWEQI